MGILLMSAAPSKSSPSKVKVGTRLSLWKKALFSFLTLVFFFGLIELVLVVIGVKPISYEEDPYVGFSSQIPLYVDTGSGGRMETSRNKLAYFNKQNFSKEKDSGVTRIFCVGGSTTYGRPYDDTTSFCGWLRELLPVADPSQKWELINAGGISYASYRVAALTEELVEYDPDVLIVYCGQNEFLERRTYSGIIDMPEAVRGLGAMLSRTRIFSGISRIVKKKPELGEGAQLDGEVNTILDQSIGPEDYERDKELEEQVLAHYRYNMARIVDIARAGGAKVLFVIPASNLRNCSPFKSQHGDGLSGEQIEQWDSLYTKAKESLAAKDLSKALGELELLAKIDDQYAAAHYLRGRVLEGLARHEEARVAYQEALDEDVCPLRALSPMPGIVKEVASDREVPLVDFVTLVDEASPNGIPGEEMFLDHVHPTIRGHRMLALAIIDEMEGADWLSLDSGWGDAAIGRVEDSLMKKVDPKKQGVAMRNLSKVYSWAGKMEDAYGAAKRALELFPGDAEAHYQVGNLAYMLGRKEEAVERLGYLVGVNLGRKVEFYLKAHAQLADILAGMGEHEKSAQVLQKLLVLDPGNPAGRGQQPTIILGQAKQLLKEGRLDEAVVKLKEVLKLDPNHFEAKLQLGVAYVRGRDFQSAVPAIKDLIKARPDYIPAYNNLSYVLAQLGQLDEAEQVCLEALKIDPNAEGVEKNLKLIRSKKAAGN